MTAKSIDIKIQEKSLQYLLNLRKVKGGEISYKELKMQGYFSSCPTKLNNDDKKMMFAYRNDMMNIPSNFHSRNQYFECITKCGHYENTEHILNCDILNEEKHNLDIRKLYNGNLIEQIEVFLKLNNFTGS